MSPVMNKPLRSDAHLQGSWCLQPVSINQVFSRDFSDSIDMNHIASTRQRLAKRQLLLQHASSQHETLIPDRRRAPIVLHGHDDEGQINVVGSSIGNLHAALDPNAFQWRNVRKVLLMLLEGVRR